MNTLGKVTTIVGLALACSAASAEPYVGMAGGMGFTNAMDKIQQETGYDIVTNKDDSKTAVSIYGGYAFNKALAVELGYTDFGKYNVSGWYNGFSSADSVSAQVVSASVVASLPLASNFGLEGKLGLGTMNQKYRCVSNCSLYMSDRSNTSLVGVIGVGAHWNLTRNLMLRTRYDYYGGANSPVNGYPDDDGTIDYSMVSVGLDWHF